MLKLVYRHSGGVSEGEKIPHEEIMIHERIYANCSVLRIGARDYSDHAIIEIELDDTIKLRDALTKWIEEQKGE